MRISCAACGNTLGESVAGLIVIRHRGREIVVTGVVALRCERCGVVWSPEPEREPTVLKVAS